VENSQGDLASFWRITTVLDRTGLKKSRDWWGTVKSVGHRIMECGGKRSATPLLLECVRIPDKAKAASRFACRRTPKEMAVADSFDRTRLVGYGRCVRRGVGWQMSDRDF